jgi:hypothetical protein
VYRLYYDLPVTGFHLSAWQAGLVAVPWRLLA